MVDKTALKDMLNHMINGNEQAAIAAFKEYLPSKTREIMGYSRDAEPAAEIEVDVSDGVSDEGAADVSDSSNSET